MPQNAQNVQGVRNVKNVRFFFSYLPATLRCRSRRGGRGGCGTSGSPGGGRKKKKFYWYILDVSTFQTFSCVFARSFPRRKESHENREFFSPFSHSSALSRHFTPAQTAPTLTRNNVFFTNNQHLPKSGLVQARLHVEAICFFFFESSRRAERKRVHGRNRRRRRPIRGEGVRNGRRDTGG